MIRQRCGYCSVVSATRAGEQIGALTENPVNCMPSAAGIGGAVTARSRAASPLLFDLLGSSRRVIGTALPRSHAIRHLETNAGGPARAD